MRRSAGQLLLAVTCALALSLWGDAAMARHNKDQRITLDNAYTLSEGDLHVGIWKLQWAPWDFLTVGTYLWPWAVKAPNLHGKAQVWSNDTFAVGAELSVIRFDPQSFSKDNPSAALTIAPFELYGSWRASEAWTFSAGLVTAFVKVEGDVDAADLQGAVAGSNAQLGATAEWRLSETFALTLHGRYLLTQVISGSATSTIQIDEYTTVEVVGTGESDVLDFSAAALTARATWSWDSFNLRVGGSYGNYTIPVIGLVLPGKIFVPDFDLYWVF